MWQRVVHAGFTVTFLFTLAACLPAAAPTSAPTTVAAARNTPAPPTTAAPLPTDVPAAAPAPTLGATQTPALTLTPASARTVAPALTAAPTPTPAPTRTASVAASARPTTAPTGAPIGTPVPTAGSALPRVIRFTMQPDTPLTVGSNFSLSWEAAGEQASLCFIDATGPTGCQDVPLTGSKTVAVTEETLWHVGVGLRASGGRTFTFSTVNLRFECPDRQWFFPNHPSRCAEKAATSSHAAAQYFEHGFMIWTERPDRFYVYFNREPGSGWQEFIWWEAPYSFVTPAPAQATPPPGLQAPLSGFGRVWRGELQQGTIDVRQRLGWATAPEFGFDTVYQCEMPAHPKLWQCYLAAPDGAVLSLHPDSSAQVRFLWERQ